MARQGSTKPNNGPTTTFLSGISGVTNSAFSITETTRRGNQPSGAIIQNGKNEISIERKSIFNSPIQFEVIDYRPTRTGGAPDKADTFFSITSASGLKTGDEDKTENQLAARTRGASVKDVFVGNSKVSRIDYIVQPTPWLKIAGLSLSTFSDGDDLILPYGIGAQKYEGKTITERGVNYISVGSGFDVVIGGYGKDFFGAVDGQVLAELEKPTQLAQSASGGSKFFVGGSSNDVLDGSNGQDLLTGDRFNGYELYLPSTALKGIPSAWDKQLSSLLSYQPQGFSDGKGAGFSILAETRSGTFGQSTPYPLWVPGNDVLRGYEGEDLIYGDDSLMDTNLFQLETIKKWISNTPSEVADAGGIRTSDWEAGTLTLGADFINAGQGNDQIYAGVGADAIIGGYGADVINTGSQIIADGYNPFFGLKVAYGDNAVYDPITMTWQEDNSSKDPDLFIIGGLYDSESVLKSSNSNQLDTLSGERKTVSESLSKFEEAWITANKNIKLIPKVGSFISSVVDAAIGLLKLQDPKPVSLTANPKATDALTVIKDFDALDQLTITVPKGEILEFTRSTFILGGLDSANLLGGGTSGTNGLILRIAKDAGTSYDRVYLQGVNRLVILGKSLDPDNKSDTYTFGGEDYASILGSDGKQVYQDVAF